VTDTSFGSKRRPMGREWPGGRTRSWRRTNQPPRGSAAGYDSEVGNRVSSRATGQVRVGAVVREAGGEEGGVLDSGHKCGWRGRGGVTSWA